MRILENLEPKAVFDYFEQICNIPHGSGNTRQISDFLVAFAKEHDLKYRQEECGNVIIFKDATAGYENAPAVMLQGHMDMVAEQDADCTKDMATEGLDLFIDGDMIGAKGTTLGGDDGIAVAMGLAVLAADDIPHGPLECLFTIDEETGMVGARALDASDLKAKYLLNLDSEADGIFTVSCAGGARIAARFDGAREAFEGETVALNISGLAGGHSGEEINKERANANILLGRALYEVSKATALRLVSVKGGSKDNAIPVSAQAVAVVADKDAALSAVEKLQKNLLTEYRVTDSGVKVEVTDAQTEMKAFVKEVSDKIVAFMFAVPNGVQQMSADIEGLVQTSTNLGRIFMEEDAVVFSFMARSSVNSQKEETVEKIESLATVLGGKVEIDSTYGAWEYRADSVLRDTMIEAFKATYGYEPKVEALHAGLECGILSEKIKDMDAVSIGPDLDDIHTPRERLHIESTKRIFELVKETLKRLK